MTGRSNSWFDARSKASEESRMNASSWVYTCGSKQAAHAHADSPARVGGTRAGRQRHYTVDMHCHMLTMAAEALVAGRPQKLAEPEFMRKAMSEESVAFNLKHMLPDAFPKLTQL